MSEQPETTAVRYALRYSDDSGERLAVGFDRDRAGQWPNRVRIETVEYIEIEPEDLDWLIAALTATRNHLIESQRHG